MTTEEPEFLSYMESIVGTPYNIYGESLSPAMDYTLYIGKLMDDASHEYGHPSPI